MVPSRTRFPERLVSIYHSALLRRRVFECEFRARPIVIFTCAVDRGIPLKSAESSTFIRGSCALTTPLEIIAFGFYNISLPRNRFGFIGILQRRYSLAQRVSRNGVKLIRIAFERSMISLSLVVLVNAFEWEKMSGQYIFMQSYRR